MCVRECVRHDYALTSILDRHGLKHGGFLGFTLQSKSVGGFAMYTIPYVEEEEEENHLGDLDAHQEVCLFPSAKEEMCILLPLAVVSSKLTYYRVGSHNWVIISQLTLSFFIFPSIKEWVEKTEKWMGSRKS